MSITSPGADVCLATMPYAEVVRPSIALGLLQASLQGSGIRAEVVFGNLDFAARIGLQHYRVIGATAADHLLGEWTFAGALFGDRPGEGSGDEDSGGEDYLERILGLGCRGISADPAECKAIIRAIRDQAGAYLDELAASILARRPRIVGCSSMFQQHCASLALLARIRDLDPEVVTLMGGANCEGEMGEATLAAFGWVDFVVSGEADSLFPVLCRQLLAQGRQADPAAFPYGVLARRQGAEEVEAADGAPPSRSIIRDLDALPIPEYDDYFTALETSGLNTRIEPGLPVESSRGCWWGEKSHCTFCGLNGIGMGYRTKSAGRVHAELAELSRRHGVRHFEFVDNILDMAHIQTLLPGLAAEGEPYTIFYETKANLRREQLQTLAAAGVRWIQPGIESLHDSVLGLIGKGNSALMNLQLLKWSRELGIRLSWNLLSGFPGESDDWYLEVADWLPHIFHLQPPSGIFNVRYDRFSPYHNRPADFGIELAPAAAYRDVYPLPADTLRRLAYYFEDAGRPRHRHRGLAATPGQLALKRLLSQWEHCWSHGATPQLRLVDEGHRLRLFDTRPGALSPRWTLDGLAMDIYRLCDSAQAPEALGQKLSARHARSISPQEVETRLDGLCKAGLLLRWHGKLFALAVAGQPRALPSDLDFPGGHVVPPRPVAQAATAG